MIALNKHHRSVNGTESVSKHDMSSLAK